MTAKNPHSEIMLWLQNEIILWLQNNRHLPIKQRRETVKLKLKDTDPAFLIHFAASAFLLNDIDERDKICEKEYDVELKNIDKERERLTRHIIRYGDEITSTALEYFESEKEQRKNANKARRDKFETIEQALKQYWLNNIDRNKRATDAAILLEKTDIFRQSSAEPKRSTLENYVRKWQKEN